MPQREDQWDAVSLGLRVGAASTACLVVAQWLDLQETALSVYTAHIIMVQYPFTSFQKGVERTFGRISGLLYGLVLVELFHGTPLLFLVLTAVGQVVCGYVYLSGRLAYTALMAAIFIGVVAATGLGDPAAAAPYVANAIPQLLLGQVAALVVNALTGYEGTLTFEAGGKPLLPLRTDWLNAAFMLSAGQMAALFVTVQLGLPVTATMVSALIVGLAPAGGQSMTRKAALRALGAVYGGGYAAGAILLLNQVPAFWLLAALVFLGMFLAACWTKASRNHSYAFLQMGLVLCQVLIAPSGRIGTVDTAFQRLVGVVVGLTVAQAVSFAWPHRPADALPPPPQAQLPEAAVSAGKRTTPPGAATSPRPG
jgi:uncharacterized membrane protein YccC